MLPHSLINQIEEISRKRGHKQREKIENLLRKGIESTNLTATPRKD